MTAAHNSTLWNAHAHSNEYADRYRCTHSSQQEDSYQQIIPGIPQGSLYHTLSSLSSEAVTSQEEAQSLRDKVSKGLEKYRGQLG